MKKVFCDRCGREIGDYDPTIFTTGRFTISYYSPEDNTNNNYTALSIGRSVDLCGACEEELANWIFTSPVNR